MIGESAWGDGKTEESSFLVKASALVLFASSAVNVLPIGKIKHVWMLLTQFSGLPQFAVLQDLCL